MFADSHWSFLLIQLNVVGEFCQRSIIEEAAWLSFKALNSTQPYRQRFPEAGLVIFDDLQRWLRHVFGSL
jgi:hypothetical protein